MNNPHGHPEDQPAVRARVPDHVAGGQISTGVIIVTGPMEFLLDFVRNMPRPNAIVSRIVLPHGVMPQFIQALEKNLDMYHKRFGAIPGETKAAVGLVTKELHATHQEPALPMTPSFEPETAIQQAPTTAKESRDSTQRGEIQPARSSDSSNIGQPIDVLPGSPLPTQNLGATSPSSSNQDSTNEQRGNDSRGGKHANPQEIYDDLKLRDELLSGTYANAVMIGHGQFEYSFDFITNFYPQSAVSARVFMAAGHVPRFLESLKASWEQLRPRFPGSSGF